MKILLIDDQRSAEFIKKSYGNTPTHIARNFAEGIHKLKSEGPFDLLFLDHDLASFDEEGNELTGYTVMNFLEENPEFLPKSIVPVSSNPVGRERMLMMIRKLYGENK